MFNENKLSINDKNVYIRKKRIMNEIKKPKHINLLFWLIIVFIVYLIFRGVQFLYYTILTPGFEESWFYSEDLYWINILYYALAFLDISIFITAMFLLARFVLNLKKGSSFSGINFKYLKVFSIFLLINCLNSIILPILIFESTASPYVTESCIEKPLISVNVLFFTAIIIWLIVALFEQGLNLQRNEDLTV